MAHVPCLITVQGWKKFVLVLICLCILIYCITSLFSHDRQMWDVNFNDWNVTGDNCGVTCKPEQHTFYIKTGDSNLYGPTICYDGKIYISNELKNYGRGLNILLIDDKTKKVTDIRSFDTYEDEAPLIRFLKKTVPENGIILVASFDDASQNLKEDSRRWLKLYGSKAVTDLSYREGFVMVGQRGLNEGLAVEFVVKKRNAAFAPYVEKAGCFDIPLGEQHSVELLLPDVLYKQEISMGEVLLNCGYEGVCQADSFPVRIDTGQSDKISFQICVNGHVMMSDALNKGGRGFNVLVIDSVHLQPTATIHVDTYNYDSTDLEVFLESLNKGDIVIAVVRDEASRKLSHPAKELLNKLGSGHIQNLKFRDVWYFIGQNGINGFTTYEQISYAGVDGEWPKALENSFCVPKKITGRQIIPDPEVHRNDERRGFCKKYKGYYELCDPAHVDDIITPVKILSQQLETNKIYSTPILIIPGMNHNALVRTLQTTLMQPGINTDFVTIFWDEKFPEYGELAGLFKFQNQSIPGSLRYQDQVMKAISAGLRLFPEKDYFIVLEEDLLLTADFLNFMSQCVETLGMDESLIGVSAWNINGYDELSGNNSLMYRVEEFPGLGFMMKRSALKLLIEPQNFKTCCTHRVWIGWNVKPELEGEMLVPDVSRVFRQAIQGAGNTDEYIQAIFNRPRVANLQSDVLLTGMNKLTNTAYEELIVDDLKQSIVVLPGEITLCYQSGGFIKEFNQSSQGTPISVFYKQDHTHDYTLLNKLIKCFGFYVPDKYPPRNLHKGLFRYYFMKRNIYLVGSETIYYPYLPQDKISEVNPGTGGG
ncbi:hypothetical protein LOTGIDRAFT_173279 [Lottia gigantea]|uniref:ILEI/PANDER domain-containing protein n=1 Tax=Lottia gigantea TaxID=225164 RepID=V4CEB5_LOTGI|nr:hypothetical protein LOTGIDRAFT_173279 [Lottia gigantea]ESP00315.1 hypothetical protein LOTGIDRAFT_173279 [Lottia gigantea]